MFNKNQTKEHTNTKRGFTLLETIVAIFILVLSITGPMVFAQNGLRAAFQSRDQVTAFYLAQDVLEYIKNVRDTNVLTGNDWLSGLGSCAGLINVESKTCSIDTIPKSPPVSVDVDIESCLDNRCDPLESYTVGNFEYYGHEGNESRFTRTVKIVEIVDGVEAQVLIEVQWINNLSVGRKRIVVQENIYNWVPSGN